jgi:hypothetical protein
MSYDTWKSLTNFVKMALNRGATQCRAKYTATTAGAIGTTSAPGADFTCTKDGGTTGGYDLTFTPCIDIDLLFAVRSAAATVNTVVVTALDAAAGTASILCSKGGTAAYLASGDVLTVIHEAITES